jgi:predicted MFS family arabinose efflux permease
MMIGLAKRQRERPEVDVAADQGEAGKRRAGGLLRERDFALLWSGETVSGVGSAMAAVGVPLLAVAVLRAGTFAVSALTAAAYLPWLLIGLPVGAWVDRLPPRPVLIISDLVSAVLYLSLPVAAWAHVLTIGQLLVVELVAGAAGIFFTTAYIVYLPVLVHPDDLLEGNAKLSGSQSVASISGRGLAGLAARAVGTANSLLFNAGSFLGSVACLLAIRTAEPRPSRARAQRTTTLRADIAEGLQFIWRDRLLRALAIWPAIANMAYGGVLALSVLFLLRVAHIGTAEVGLLLAVSDIGGLAGALVARRVAQRVGTARVLLLGVLVGGMAGLLIPLTAAGPRAAFFVVGSGIVTGAITAANIVLISFRQTYTPAEVLGRIIASQRFLVYGTAPLGALLAGVLGTVLGVRQALWVLVAVYALSGTLLLTGPILSRRDLPTSPEQTRPDAQDEVLA